jgi:hypothetical protein
MKGGLALVFVAACVTAALAAETSRHWKAVPGHDGVFVDLASIKTIDLSRWRPRPAHHMRPPETEADVMVNGQILEHERFWCHLPGMVVGDTSFGECDPNAPPEPCKTSGTYPTMAVMVVVCKK